MTDIQKGDPGARRRALVLIAVGAIVGATTILLARQVLPAAGAWVADDVDGRLPIVALGVALLPTLPLVASGIYLWQLGSRVAGARRFPPPGQRVVKDVPVIEGTAAVKRGQTLRLSGLILIVAALAAATLLWRLFTNLAGRS